MVWLRMISGALNATPRDFLATALPYLSLGQLDWMPVFLYVKWLPWWGISFIGLCLVSGKVTCANK